MNKSVMLIDDSPEILELCGMIFKIRGYTVFKAMDSMTALEMLEESTPDVFIVDVMMPEINGIELCKRIRALPQHKETPVLILSAYSDSDIVERAFASGANDYVFKPIDPNDLEKKVRDLLAVTEG